MPTKFLNISVDSSLGGVSPSDEIVCSQKAIKTYVDNNAGNFDYTTFAGYDSTKNQVLTHESGTLKWVDKSGFLLTSTFKWLG